MIVLLFVTINFSNVVSFILFSYYIILYIHLLSNIRWIRWTY